MTKQTSRKLEPSPFWTEVRPKPAAPPIDDHTIVANFLRQDRWSFDSEHLGQYFEAGMFELLFKHACASEEIGAAAHNARNAAEAITFEVDRADVSQSITATMAGADRQLHQTLIDGLKLVAKSIIVPGPDRLAAWDFVEEARS